MALNRVAVAQRGIALADVVAAGDRPKAKRAVIRKKRGGRKRPAKGRAAALTGPFLAPGSLTRAERRRLIDGFEQIFDGVFAHLPLKRARYGFDPVQRLRILRTQVDDLADDAFHIELADIVTRLRDAHTRYEGPATLSSKVAVLPFMVEMIGSPAKPTYVVTKVAGRLDRKFAPGVVIEHWNGVPIDRAVQSYGDREVGGRLDTRRAWATQSLTMRALQYGPPPDELWVVVGYRRTTAGGRPTGKIQEIRIPWKIVDPDRIAASGTDEPTGRAAAALRRKRAIDPAAAAMRRAKMLLFAPDALAGKQPAARKRPQSVRGSKKPLAADDIPSALPETLKAMSIQAPGGPFGYLRIWSFETGPERFIAELLRLIPLLPERGLVIDVRANPGGYIWSAELALQLFTPKRILPTKFSVLATAFTREMAAAAALREEMGPWKESLEAAVRNGELYSQPIPITDPEECNVIGQQYGGPVVLVGDSTTYSSGDLFSAGFVDNEIGPFICAGEATGAGGANVWDYADLRAGLAGTPLGLPALPDGVGLSFSFRRATRSGPSEGIPIEDIGIAGTPYAMTRKDLLSSNRDLLRHCIAVLGRQPFTRLAVQVDARNRRIKARSTGLDRLDVMVDGHPGSSHLVGAGAGAGAQSVTAVSYPARTRVVEIIGYAGDVLRQRRRVRTRR